MANYDCICAVIENKLVICTGIKNEFLDRLGGNCISYTIFTAEKIRLC
jgi:hypothetical protein